MTPEQVFEAACALSIDDRLALIDTLWESVEPEEERLGQRLLTPKMKAELDRRIAEVEADTDEGKTWDEFMASRNEWPKAT
jgi:putative addiction module component (TIGR02574 family)